MWFGWACAALPLLCACLLCFGLRLGFVVGVAECMEVVVVVVVAWGAVVDVGGWLSAARPGAAVPVAAEDACSALGPVRWEAGLAVAVLPLAGHG